ncbi:GNAT family N-acetyltransferase [Nocardioides pantholopis]|uniref:GNAT family N-acetyltransferase n=1 Tax=Nocardioides pantholopis TaxID=2483798 RepID=UPI000F077125|nr:GNAT family N-acetyltransferase [Nocardioides pantholopis]
MTPPPGPAGAPGVRAARVEDLAAVQAIYAEQVRTSTSTFDVLPPSLEDWAGKLAATLRPHHFLVAIDDDGVQGYAYSSAYRPRPAYAATRETSIHLAPRARGRGLGRLLYDELLARLRADGAHVVLAVVALPNPASRALHLACGFASAGVLREVGHKLDTWVDTEFFQLLLD